MKKSLRLAALRRQVALPAFTDYWASMIGLVGQLAARRLQVALPKANRLPADQAFRMIGLVDQLVAR